MSEADRFAVRQQQARPVYDERVVMEVERFQLSRDGGEEWAYGHAVVDPSVKVAVRLSTLDERLSDLPRADPAKLRNSYEGDKRRESLSEKAKDKIKFISFEGARPLGKDEEGVFLFRAHWPSTMAARPEAEVIHGLGSVVLFPGSETSKPEAYVEFLRHATLTDGSNVQQALESALAIRDGSNQPREGHALMRVFYDGNEVASARVYSSREPGEVKDPVYGDTKTVNLPCDGARTFERLMAGEALGRSAQDAHRDMARALVAGMTGAAMPKAVSLEQAVVENFYHGAASGELVVDVVAVERMRFGQDSAKTYLRDHDQPKLKGYTIRSENENGGVNFERGYCETVVAMQRYSDGQPYAIFAGSDTAIPFATPLRGFGANNPLSEVIPRDPNVPAIKEPEQRNEVEAGEPESPRNEDVDFGMM